MITKNEIMKDEIMKNGKEAAVATEGEGSAGDVCYCI